MRTSLQLELVGQPDRRLRKSCRLGLSSRPYRCRSKCPRFSFPSLVYGSQTQVSLVGGLDRRSRRRRAPHDSGCCIPSGRYARGRRRHAPCIVRAEPHDYRAPRAGLRVGGFWRCRRPAVGGDNFIASFTKEMIWPSVFSVAPPPVCLNPLNRRFDLREYCSARSALSSSSSTLFCTAAISLSLAVS